MGSQKSGYTKSPSPYPRNPLRAPPFCLTAHKTMRDGEGERGKLPALWDMYWYAWQLAGPVEPGC